MLMTLNDMFRSAKGHVQKNITLTERFILQKLFTEEKPDTPSNPPIRTSDNEILYTNDGEAVRTIR